MNPETYARLPDDVKDFTGNSIHLDDAIQQGLVNEYRDGVTIRTMTSDRFVAERRAARKRERQNRRRGRAR